MNLDQVMSDAVTLELYERSPLMRFAYCATDGSPRVIPLGYLMRDGLFSFCTIPTSDKVAALKRDTRVAITIDSNDPLCCLLVRGDAWVETVQGVPDDYLESSHRGMAPETWSDFDAQVRALYDSMVRVTITPTWARLNDFQRTAPRAVERLIAEKSAQ